MSISCSCSEGEYEPGDTVYYSPVDYATFPQRRRRVRCRSCNTLISPGDTVAEWKRFKIPDSDVEVRIYGEDGEVPMASWWMCETCADLAFSIQELGFCVSPFGNMLEDAKEAGAMMRGISDS